MPGIKDSGTDSRAGKPAIVTYVYQKQQLAANDPNLVPEVFKGVPTDVREVPTPAADSLCHGVMMNLSWAKIDADHQKQKATGGGAAPGFPAAVREGDFIVLSDPNGDQYFTAEQGPFGRYFNVIQAYRDVTQSFPQIKDSSDFVAFLIHSSLADSFHDTNLHYYCPARNDVANIDFYMERATPGARYDQRSDWGQPTALRGCQVHLFFGTVDLRRLLHEVGHAWCAYVQPADSLLSDGVRFVDLPDAFHWTPETDTGFTCMDTDTVRWVFGPDGRVKREPIADSEFAYCELDLYLMGLKAPTEITEVRVVQPTSTPAPDGFMSAQVTRFTMAQIMGTLGGQRMPTSATSPKQFRQSFVILAKDQATGVSYAQDLIHQELLTTYAGRFSAATGGSASLITSLP